MNVGGCMKYISVIGSCNMDMIVESDIRPKAGETVMGKRLILSPGGKGANQAVAAAKVGGDVYMIGCVGDDANGEMMCHTLQNSGVNTKYVNVLSHEITGTAHIILAEGDNSIIVLSGANGKVNQAVVDKAWDIISQSAIILLQHEIPLDTVGYIIQRAYDEKIPVLLNPAPYADIPKDWIDKVSYLTPNEHEAALIFPHMTREEILHAYPRKVVMTIGKEGVIYGDNDSIVHVPGFDVSVVDTTGAGDTFNGAFAVACTEGKSMEEAVRFANAAAALSVGKIGAQAGMPVREEVEELLSCKR